MKQAYGKSVNGSQGWILFFYSVPSKPVSNRMKIWRRLSKSGAVLLKGAVYVLPMSEEHYEFFQWLVSEVSSLGGEAAFTRAEVIDSIKDEEIKALFDERMEREYQGVGKALNDVETKVDSVRKGSKSQSPKALSEQFAKVSRSFEDALKTDFFSSKPGILLRSRIDALTAAIKGLSGAAPETKPPGVPPRKFEDYQGKVWASRKRPFVDRMASAWLIRRFIDKNATFKLMEERDFVATGQDYVTFDVSGGVFTHVGDFCTFEVLIRTFGVKDKTVRRIAEIVHELDIKDDKYRTPEAAGLEQILSGLRKAIKDDSDLLEKGMSVFEMLYLSKTG